MTIRNSFRHIYRPAGASMRLRIKADAESVYAVPPVDAAFDGAAYAVPKPTRGVPPDMGPFDGVVSAGGEVGPTRGDVNRAPNDIIPGRRPTPKRPVPGKKGSGLALGDRFGPGNVGPRSGIPSFDGAGIERASPLLDAIAARLGAASEGTEPGVKGPTDEGKTGTRVDPPDPATGDPKGIDFGKGVQGVATSVGIDGEKPAFVVGIVGSLPDPGSTGGGGAGSGGGGAPA